MEATSTKERIVKKNVVKILIMIIFARLVDFSFFILVKWGY